MRYRLRTLLIVLALGKPLLWVGWGKYEEWRAEQERLKALPLIIDEIEPLVPLAIPPPPPSLVPDPAPPKAPAKAGE